MANSFKYIFVDSKTGWNIGSSHHSLSFSANGKTLAGTTPETSSAARNGRVQFWDADSGVPRGSYDGWSLAQFSPTEADKILLLGGTYGTVMMQAAADSTSWIGLGSNPSITTPVIQGCYKRDGTSLSILYNSSHLYEWTDKFAPARAAAYPVSTISSFIYSPDGLWLIGHNDGRVVIQNASTSTPLSQVGSRRVGVCAWSPDNNWLATGDDAGDIRLWNAGNTANISLVRIITCANRNNVTSLVFVPDSTALIIVCGGSIHVWDIGQGRFLDDRTGLPPTARNIALDMARKRVAVAVDNRVSLYELKLPETQPPVAPQPKGKPVVVPPELAAMDITAQVIRSKPDPFVGMYFDIHRGAWKVTLPSVAFQHVVAIKSLRPGFDPRSKPQERKDFQALLSKSLNTWYNMKNDNIVPLLGISMNFGKFPAMVTSWMMNGLLTEYLNSDEDYDKMHLTMGVGSGVAYLHSQNVVHSDIRASSVLVDELGNARLADPGLLNVLEKSPLMVGEGTGSAYRWMAPELLNDPPAKTSFATDVYAFTMTSLEIFTGTQPFASVKTALIPGKILQSQRPDRPADITDALWALWNEGWNQDSAKRPDMKAYLIRLGGLV